MSDSSQLLRYGFSSKVVLPSGDGSSGIAVVGEAPGKTEDETGLPFHPHADAGSQLERILRLGGWSRDHLTLTNAVWQRPPDNRLEGEEWEEEALAVWRDRLGEAVAGAKVIIALGNIPLKALCPDWGGEGKSITSVAQYKLRSRWGQWVIPTYHPAYIMRGKQNLVGASLFAFSEAFRIVREGFVYEEPEFLLDPTLDEFEAWARDYNPERHFLNYDIETPKSGKLDEEELEEDPSYTIIRASLSYQQDRVVSFPWQEPYISTARRLLNTFGPKRSWNGRKFDNPRLRASGCELNGRLYDSMDLWRHLQRSLPAALRFVTPFYGWSLPPWKHESGDNPSYYSACDALALHLCGEGIEADLRAAGRWENAESHVVDCYEVLSLMSKTGLPYDLEKAREKEGYFQQLKDDREALLQSLVPDAVKPSKQSKGYKKVPKVLEGLQRRSFRLKPIDLSKAEIDALGGSVGPGTVTLERWCLLKPFNPQSFRQLIALIKHYGHTPAKNHKTKEETSEDDSLKKLIKKCETRGSSRDRELARILRTCREVRQLGKVLGTYLRGWKTGSDRRIHSTPGFWGDMYRISWRRPNIAATIADKEEEQLASGFRECVAAPEGRILIEADWKGMESLLVAYFASDPDYERLSRLGIHDYLCSHLLVTRGKLPASKLPSLDWPDHDLKKFFKWIKETYPKDRDDAKHCIHGCLSGDHEVLTENGWVRFDRYNFKDPIAEWDAKDGSVRFAPPRDYVAAPWHGEIIEVRGRAISFNATPDHAFPARKGKPFYERTPAESLDKLHRVPVTGCYQFPGEIECPVRLAAAVQADASVYGSRAVFHLVRERKIERLRNLLVAGGHEFTEQPCNCHPTGIRFRVTLPDIPILTGKIFNELVLKLSRQQVNELLEEVLYWDGCQRESRYQYYMSTEYRNAMWIQTIAHLSGREALLRHNPKRAGSYGMKPVYEVRFNRRREARIGGTSIFRYPFRGNVYCVTTGTGYFMARHNNRVFVSGNTNYGMGPFLMSELYEMPLREAKNIQKLYFEIFPRIKRWQEGVLERAHREHKLTNPFKYSIWMWDVLKWNPKTEKHDLGKDAKSAISFLPRDTGAAMLREVLLRLEEKHQFASRGIMLASTHDSILCECSEEELDEIAGILKAEMEAPVPELNNLVIGVDVAYGRWWVKDSKSPFCMKEWKSPEVPKMSVAATGSGVSYDVRA